MIGRWHKPLLVAALLAQLGLPLHYILHGQQVLASGTRYRLATAPVDPVDPFRGRYVQLGFPGFAQPATHDEGDWYVPLLPAGDGSERATLGPPQRMRPASGDWLRLRPDAGARGVLRLPFERWYLDESLAPEAERAYRLLNRRRADGEPAQTVPAELAIRVLDGEAIPEMLYLDGLPVRDYLLRDAAGATP